VTEQSRLTLSPAPHVRGKTSISRDMYLVVLALLLPAAGAVYFFGLYVLLMLGVGVISCVLTEVAAKALRRKSFHMDGSAVITGLLLVLVLPPRSPLWVVVIGSVFAIGIAKEAFGGLGCNIFNPALAGRAFVSISFAGVLGRWILPTTSWLADAVTSATPLSEGFVTTMTKPELYRALFLGHVGGSAGETSALLILIGGAMLLAFGIIKWHIPVFYIATVFVLSWIMGQDPLFHILAGGLMLGAFFMATDYVTGPLTTRGRILFAVGAGVLVVLIRLIGSMPEGVAYSILVMNAFTPLIDRYTRPRPLGMPRKSARTRAGGE